MTDILLNLPDELKLEIVKNYSKYTVSTENISYIGPIIKKSFSIKNLIGHCVCYNDIIYTFDCLKGCKFNL